VSPATDGRAQRRVDADDVDDVIGVALERRQLSEAQLSEAELAAVGAELGLSAEQIGGAITELQARRARDSARRVVAQRRRRRLGIGVAIAAAVVVVAALGSQASLRTRLAEVERTRAQLASVRQTQQEARARYAAQTLTVEREAELAGADNRVRIERMRHDEAAAAYNRQAAGLLGRLGAVVGGLPARVPLSDEGGAR
jgi:hypothetical protein